MERPFALDHLDHIVLRVRNLERSIAFYQMLGCAPPREVQAGQLMRVVDGQSIILQGRSDYVPTEVGAIDHINLAIRAADIEEVATYLRANGAEIVGEPQVSSAGPTVFVHDPDGYLLEIRMVRDAA